LFKILTVFQTQKTKTVNKPQQVPDSVKLWLHPLTNSSFARLRVLNQGREFM